MNIYNMTTTASDKYWLADSIKDLFPLQKEPTLTIREQPLSSFEERVKTYVNEKSPHLIIMTPCYGGTTYVNYTISLIKTIRLFEKWGIGITIEFCKNDSLITRARNNLIAKAMSKPQMTHMLFIDTDITWEPSDILKLLISDKPLVGGAYPLKRYHWEKLVKDPQNPYHSNVIQGLLEKKKQGQLNSIVTDTDYIRHNLLNYNINFLSKEMKIEPHNLAKVRHLATGFMMMKRGVIEKMSDAFPSTKYTDDVGFLNEDENRFAYALFDCGVEEGHYYSEDWLFCHRWTRMGGEVFVDVSIALSHQGVENYEGFFLSTLL